MKHAVFKVLLWGLQILGLLPFFHKMWRDFASIFKYFKLLTLITLYRNRVTFLLELRSSSCGLPCYFQSTRSPSTTLCALCSVWPRAQSGTQYMCSHCGFWWSLYSTSSHLIQQPATDVCSESLWCRFSWDCQSAVPKFNFYCRFEPKYTRNTPKPRNTSRSKYGCVVFEVIEENN